MKTVSKGRARLSSARRCHETIAGSRLLLANDGALRTDAPYLPV